VRLFIDTNVVLDVLAKRDPWFGDAARVLAHVEQGRASGHIAAHTLTTLHYLLTRHLGQGKTAAVLIDLTTLLRVEPVDHEVLQQALALGWRDFEDAVQAVAAARSRADYLVTRNPRDFRQSLVPVITPPELLTLLG
jgi:predicted nucleic acid-binding protein